VRLKAAFLVTRDGKGEIGIGDSIVITFDDEGNGVRKTCIVIDGGYSRTAKFLKSYLDAEGIATIDLIVATHIDDDHINGLRTFFDDYVEDDGPFRVLNYWGPAPRSYEPVTITGFLALLPEAAGLGIEELTFVSQSVDNNEKLWEAAKACVGEGHIWHPSAETSGSVPALFRSVKIEILGPARQVPSKELESAGVAAQGLGDAFLTEGVIDLRDRRLRGMIAAAAAESDHTANNQSIVFRLTPIDRSGREVAEQSFLFPGDADLESWRTMIAGGNRHSLKARYLKVAHHGSVTGTDESVLDNVRPEYGIICAGKNKHGLPDRSVFKLLQDRSVKIICTGRNPNTKDIPCAEESYEGRCPRRDAVTPVVFEIDTDRPPGGPPLGVPACGNDWS
jgi:hypothetical protein